MSILQKMKAIVKNQRLSELTSDYICQIQTEQELEKSVVRKKVININEKNIVYRYLLEGILDNDPKLVIQGEFSEEKVEIICKGKNLYNGKRNAYYLKKDSMKEYGKRAAIYRTTDWFEIDETQGYLNMTGDGFNRAVWQFRDANGNLLETSLPDKMEKYRVKNQKHFDRTCAKIAIPKNAVEARVYFAREDEKDCAELGETLQISYGLIPEFCTEYYEDKLLIDVTKQTDSIVLRKNGWELYDKEQNLLEFKEHGLNLERIESFSFRGIKNGKIFIQDQNRITKEKNEKEYEYGIRWNMESSIPLCERIGDALDMRFNYRIEGSWAAKNPNDFDSAFPWNQMRVCAVKIGENKERTICYEGEEGFARDGSAGEVMVEIPAYYTKREQKDGYEYIWITGTLKEGYELDPSFSTKEGNLEHIYVSAYMGCENKGVVHSHSNTFVTLRRSMKEWMDMIDSSRGYDAYDLLIHLTLQRLFLVETAVLDSQSIFDGVVYLPYKVINTKTAYYALETKLKTNEIIVKDTPITRRLLVGDSATVLVHWKDYKNIPKYQRTVVKTTPIEQDRLIIQFSGKPINIYKEKTAISALTRRNGDTDRLTYHTGRGNENARFFRGHESFKYRGIENLWGGAWITFANCYVKNNRLYIKYPDGTEKRLSYELPVQNVILTSKQFGAPTEMCVKEMGYDQEYPLLMLPSVIGNGASTNTFYCDAWYNIAETDVEYLLTYGGAWDNLGYAGIFCYRANYTMEDRIPFNSVRIILR